MNAVDLLRSDHDRIEELFVQVEQTPTPTERLNLFRTIKDELLLLMHMEETALYPPCAEKSALTQAVDLGYARHDLIKNALVLIGEMADETEFNQSIESLIDLAREHFQQEERDLFPKMETSFDEDELDDLGDSLIDARERLTPAA
jgi:hemerythrin superfamily protein